MGNEISAPSLERAISRVIGNNCGPVVDVVHGKTEFLPDGDPGAPWFT